MIAQRITDLESATSPSSNDLFLMETEEATKSIRYEDLVKQAIDEAVEKACAKFDNRNTYRGQYLGDHVTDEQLAAIRDGSFKGLFIGDYWTIDNRDWLIADMNYWLNCGDTVFTKNHLVIFPSRHLYRAKMNETNTTEGGYVGSQMYKTGLDQAKETINAAFGDMVLIHRELLVNAVSNGKPSGGVWVDSAVELPNEYMVYGHHHFTPTNNGSSIPYLYTIDKTQLALFRMRPELLVDRSNAMWLRDVVSAVAFAYVGYPGGTDYSNASYSLGVYPIFAIG